MTNNKDCYVVISDNFEITILKNVVYTCVNYYNKSINEVTNYLNDDLISTLSEVFNLSESEVCFAMTLECFLFSVEPIIEKYKD